MIGKRALRGALEGAARVTGLLARFERQARGSLTILTYHRVLPDEHADTIPFPSLVMPASAFQAEMRHLARHYTVLPVHEALARLYAGNGPSDRPLVSVTFDDGYADNARVAAPILAQHGLRATFFVVWEFVQDRAPLWFDRAARALLARGLSLAQVAAEIEAYKRLEPAILELRVDQLDGPEHAGREVAGAEAMTTGELVALARAGHEIGAHTLSHAMLPPLDDAQLDAELDLCRSGLETLLGERVGGLCYPNGDHDERVRRAAARTGYAYGCSTAAGRNLPGVDPYALRRVDITPGRVLDGTGRYTETAFRSEISLLREGLWRRRSTRGSMP